MAAREARESGRAAHGEGGAQRGRASCADGGAEGLAECSIICGQYCMAASCSLPTCKALAEATCGPLACSLAPLAFRLALKSS